MPDVHSRRILEHITDRRYQPTRIDELAQELSVPPDEFDEFIRTVHQLVEDGQVVLGAGDSVALPPPGREMTGSFRLNERGFGFLVPDSAVQHGDLFVPAGKTGGAMTGDRVKARVIIERGRAGGGRSPFTGQIVQILQRAERRYTGNLRKNGSVWVVDPDGTALREAVVIRDPNSKYPAGAGPKAGTKVVFELLEYPTANKPAQGVITEVLGEQGEPDVETAAVMHAYNLADKFPTAVVDDARVAAQGFNEQSVPPEREDLTGEFICTIDPPDAKDFDDAISIKQLSEGNAAWELGVHIAHVSTFVRKGTALDTEAYKRGNSAYLPRRVIPMLPELLSNGVCSLQEGVNRFCLSAFIRYDAMGNVVGQRFSRSVIRSAKRLTYLEAQALIDGDIREAIKHAKTEAKYPRQLIPTLKLMDELAKTIRQRRLRDGMIVLGLPDVDLVFDESGRVVDAVKEDDAFTHTLIEMFMVEANEAAARLFNNLNVPMIRRIHPEPPVHDIDELRSFARVAGYNIPAKPDRKQLQQLLDSVRGKPAQTAVHLAVLKTLSKAVYSPMLVGHFALASEHYTHFTSPIRRYPDLVVHRGLDAYLDAKSRVAVGPKGHSSDPSKSKLGEMIRDDPRVPSEEALHTLGDHCSTTERNAESAEHELRNYLVLDLLAAHLGDDYDGTVTGVTGSGVFVQLDRYLVDGFVRSDALPGPVTDTWKLNRTTGALVAQRSGKSITIGNRFKVRIVRVNPARRQMEVAIVGQFSGERAPAGSTPPAGLRKSREAAERLKRDRRKAHKNRRRR